MELIAALFAQLELLQQQLTQMFNILEGLEVRLLEGVDTS